MMTQLFKNYQRHVSHFNPSGESTTAAASPTTPVEEEEEDEVEGNNPYLFNTTFSIGQ